jgi:hypothetical protein
LKNTFWPCYGHFEYVVMPFGLTNALIVFQHLMSNIWVTSLFVTLMTFSSFLRTWKNMKQHVWFILDKFRQVKFYVKFHQIKMEFLKYIISKDDICIILHKVQTIMMGYPNLCWWCSMFSSIPQLLLMLHCTLFHDSDPCHSLNSKISNFCLEIWGQSVHFNLWKFFSQWPHF